MKRILLTSFGLHSALAMAVTASLASPTPQEPVAAITKPPRDPKISRQQWRAQQRRDAKREQQRFKQRGIK